MRLESPFVVQRTLGDIHDSGYLGTRVVLEFIGAVAGVMIGWYASVLAPRRKPRTDKRDAGLARGDDGPLRMSDVST